MAKFCTKCGASLSDDATFCTTCGTPQQGAPVQQQNYAQQGMNMNNFTQAAGNAAQNAGAAVKNTFDGVSFDSVKNAMSVDDIKNVGKTKNKNTIIGLAACGCALLIVIIILIAILSTASAGYKKPIDNFIKAVNKSDGEALAAAFPEYTNDQMEDLVDDYYDDYDSVEEYYSEELLEDLHDNLEDEYGSNVKISYKIVKKKEIKKSKLNDLEDSIEDDYDEKVSVDKGYEVKVKMTIKGKEDKDENTAWLNVYKIDGKWCITESSFSSLS